MNKSKSSKRRVSRRKSSKKVSKSVKLVVKQMIAKQVETKTINVPDPDSMVLSNTVNKSYLALQGVQYLAVDVFKNKQGGQDSTTLSAFNRIGDKVQGIGFLMDYYFHLLRAYSIGATVYTIPFVKLRVIVFRQPFGFTAPTQQLILDDNFLFSNTSTLQPINWDEGYVKEVLYDKTYVIRASESISTNTTFTNVLHFKKYIKFDRPIRYNDNNSTSPENTDKPIYVAILAELDDSTSGLVPSNTPILRTTGYTRAWYKDA